MISVKEKQSIYIGGIDNEKNNGVCHDSDAVPIIDGMWWKRGQ